MSEKVSALSKWPIQYEHLESEPKSRSGYYIRAAIASRVKHRGTSRATNTTKLAIRSK